MHIPFFSEEDNFDAFKKMKVMFLINRIRFADFSIFLLWFFPFAINLIQFIIIKGKNQMSLIWCPYGSVFRSNPSINDWSETWHGLLHLCLLLLSIVFRVSLSCRLLKKMKQYQTANPRFKWNKHCKLWAMLFVPFVSFVVYPVLLKATSNEISHKYNI